MKPMQIIAIVGCLAAALVGGWFMYMQNSEQFERAAQRGLPLELKQAASEAAALATTAVPSAAAIAVPSAAAIAAPADAATAAPSAAAIAVPAAATTAAAASQP